MFFWEDFLFIRFEVSLRVFFSYIFFVLCFSLSGCEQNEDWEVGMPVPAAFHTGYGDSFGVKGERYSVLQGDNIIGADDESVVIVSVESEPWPTGYFADTRTSWGNDSYGVTWATGDQLGIYMRYASGTKTVTNNIPYKIVAGGTNSSAISPVSSAIYFPNLISDMRFYAYYPYSSGTTTVNPIKSPTDSLLLNYSLPADQSLPSTLRNCDIMCATSALAKGSAPNVTLPFNHKMTLLSFKITSNSILSQTLTKVTVSGSAVTGSGTLNLKTATLVPSTGVTFSPFVSKNQYAFLNNYAYADIIINPCTVGANTLAGELKVALTFQGLLNDKTTKLVSNVSFTGGTRYVYTLNVTLL